MRPDEGGPLDVVCDGTPSGVHRWGPVARRVVCGHCGVDSRPAVPSAQPDERRCTCDTWNRWSNNHSVGCPVLLTTDPAQPDEPCPQCGERLPLDRVCLCCTYAPAQPDEVDRVAELLSRLCVEPGSEAELARDLVAAGVRFPAQPVRDTEEGRR